MSERRPFSSYLARGTAVAGLAFVPFTEVLPRPEDTIQADSPPAHVCYDELYNPLVLGQGPQQGKDTYCVGMAITPSGHVISILRNQIPGEPPLIQNEYDPANDGEYGGTYISKDDEVLTITDQRENNFTFIKNEAGYYTLVSSRLVPTAEPAEPLAVQLVRAGSQGLDAIRNGSLVDIAHAQENRMCVDSWGDDDIPFGVDRPGTDDCVDIQQEGIHTRYIYKTEDGRRIDVVYNPQTKEVFWDIKDQTHFEDISSVPKLQQEGIFLKIQQFFAQLFKEETAQPSAPIEKKPIPDGVVTERTMQWYNLIYDVNTVMGVDPRTHLSMVDIESVGDPVAESWAGAQGLVQIMPDTWQTIRNTINNNPALQLQAQNLGINPNSANPNHPKENAFFSAVYLIHYCGMPTGPIPTHSFTFETYIQEVRTAVWRYHDGPNADTTSPKAVEYKNGMEARLRKIMQ